MGNTPNNSTSPPQIIKIHYPSGFRDYFKDSDGWNRSSEWITLKKGQPYYMEAKTSEHGGNDHFSVAVEIKQTEIVGHHHSFKERQWLSIDPENNKDTARITVENADNGQYVLIFKHPKTLKTTNSKPISAKATAQ